MVYVTESAIESKDDMDFKVIHSGKNIDKRVNRNQNVILRQRLLNTLRAKD